LGGVTEATLSPSSPYTNEESKSPDPSPPDTKQPRSRHSMVRHKYMGQLTLAVIESEGGLALHNKQSTAGSAGTRFRGAQPRTNRTIGE
jgi:hypothetical protein